MRLSWLFLLFCALGLIGCAGVDAQQVSGVSLTFSDPSSPYNMNLTQMISGTSFVRNTDVPLSATVAQTPGPSGVTTRTVNVYIDNPVIGADYALVSGGTTYVEYDEAVSTGTNSWRSTSGKLTLVKDDINGTTFKLTGIQLAPYNGAAEGTFNLDGNIWIVF